MNCQNINRKNAKQSFIRVFTIESIYGATSSKDLERYQLIVIGNPVGFLEHSTEDVNGNIENFKK
jgi:hypothetical protein